MLDRAVTRLCGLVLLLASCSGPAHQVISGASPDRPRLRFLDGSVSANDRCPITGGRLNPRMDPLRVNGRSIGFC